MAIPKIIYKRAKFYTEGRTEPVRAFVNHRMVGTLAGTDRYFTVSTDRAVSTHFGIGVINGKLEVHQYVPLDDTAYGNGNYDASGNWDNWGYKTTEINPQTISIEHQDHDGIAEHKGIVSEAIQRASIELQAILLRADKAEWERNGIIVRDWARNFPILQRELRAIRVGPRTIITHNDIAGKLKPYCWKPWQYDKIGFPREKYVTGILNHLEPPKTYTQEALDKAVASAVEAATKAQASTLASLRAEIDRLNVQVTSLQSERDTARAKLTTAKGLAISITEL